MTSFCLPLCDQIDWETSRCASVGCAVIFLFLKGGIRKALRSGVWEGGIYELLDRDHRITYIVVTELQEYIRIRATYTGDDGEEDADQCENHPPS